MIMLRKAKDGGIDAPQSLSGLFQDDSDNENEKSFEQTYEEQSVQIASTSLIIRQYVWHMANANKVWPGTFNLGEFLEINLAKYAHCNILELGAATGALSIFLKTLAPEISLITSDIDDGGEVESNISYNFRRNGK
jgi:methylase of polypeptide subunit release factors